MVQPSSFLTVYTFHDGPPPAPVLHEGPTQRCDVCDSLIPGAPAGEGVYLWTRGDEPHFEAAPLCDACATAIGVSSLRHLDEEEEEGGLSPGSRGTKRGGRALPCQRKGPGESSSTGRMPTNLNESLAVVQNNPKVMALIGRGALILLTLALAWLSIRVLRTIRDQSIERLGKLQHSDDASAERALHLGTLANVLFDVVKALIYGFVLLTILSQCGVSVQPLVAGAGLIGAAMALGSQTIVKDFVSGCFILLENHFAIGDQISVSPTISGVVEGMTLRVTTIRDVDGAVHIIPNGSISTITNRTYRWAGTVVNFATPAASGVTPVRTALETAIRAVVERDPEKESLMEEPTLSGPNNIKGSAIEWAINARTHNGHSAKVKSWIVEEVVRELAKAQLPLA